MTSPWFETWGRLGELVVVLVGTYAWLIVVLRVSGKRTLAKLNAFDFVVTIALGSMLSTVIVSRQVPVVDGAVALVGLVALQWLAAKATTRWSWFDRMVKSDPTAILVDGRLRPDAMEDNRIRTDEVAAALRKQGIASFEDVACVVLETDGSFSVLRDVDGASTLAGVRGLEGSSIDPAPARPPGA